MVDLSVVSGDSMESKRVLYVDDEPALVALTIRGLGRLGYRVTGCSDPLKAVAMFRDDPFAFDAIVTDLSMPMMTGFALAREARGLRDDIPILLMSGFVSATDQIESDACGIHAIVLKPITLDKLSETLREVFDACDRTRSA
jgi:CheY-like chemotaxis protein